jgi:large subunit ribosomal protein L4
MAETEKTQKKTTVKKETKTKASPKSAASKVNKTKEMSAAIYSAEGKETGKITLPENVFNAKWNPDLIHQVTFAETSNKRVPVAHVKERGEVRGGGKKPWRQKGTGRARHGSTRSPIWAGGGVTFGPRNERNYKKKINKKMRKNALYVVLSQKLRDGELLFVDDLHFDKPSAKSAMKVLQNLSTIKGFETILSKRKNSALITLPGKDMSTEKSLNNFGNLDVNEWRNLNPSRVLSSKYLVISHPKEAIEFLESKTAK